MEREETTRPFEDLRVVDASRVLAGPSCCQLLADLGADVIKIESPEGDENRRWPPLMANVISSNYASVNRGKQGITLDLKNEAAGPTLWCTASCPRPRAAWASMPKSFAAAIPA